MMKVLRPQLQPPWSALSRLIVRVRIEATVLKIMSLSGRYTNDINGAYAPRYRRKESDSGKVLEKAC